MPTLTDADLKRLRDLVQVSKAYSEDKFVKARRPEMMRRWFSGDHYGKGMPLSWVSKRDRVVVNISQANVYGKVSRLAKGNPAITVLGLDNESYQRREQEKHFLEYKWREIHGLKAAREALFDIKIVGTGALATGWTAKRAEEGSATQAQPVNEGEEGQQAPKFVIDRPVVRCVRPEMLILDPDSPNDIQRGWWMGETIVIPLMRLRKMTRYKDVGERLQGETGLPEAWVRNLETSGDLGDEHLRGVTIHVIYLRDSLLRVELCDELKDEPLHVGDRPGKDYPQDDDGRPYFPYVVGRNIPDYNGVRGGSTHFGIGDIEVNETEQIETDVGRSIMAMHRRMGVPLFLGRKGALDKAAKALLSEGKYNALIEVDGVATNENLSSVLMELRRQPVAPEVYSTVDQARRDMSELTRMTSWERAGDSPNIKLATVANMMQTASSVGKAMESEEFEQFVVETIEQVSWLLHEWGDMPELVEIPNQAEPVQMTGISLKGRYSYNIEPTSMEPPNTEADERKWFARLQAIMPYAQQGANVRPLLEQWLNSFDAPKTQEILAGLDANAELKQQVAQAAQLIDLMKQRLIELGAAPGQGEVPPGNGGNAGQGLAMMGGVG